MYSVYRKHRILKVILLTLGLVAGSFIVTPAINLAKGRKIEASSLIGNYAFGIDHQVVIYNPSVGKMVSEDVTVQFFYTFENGVISCDSENLSWEMRSLGDGNIFNCFDNYFLLRGEQ